MRENIGLLICEGIVEIVERMMDRNWHYWSFKVGEIMELRSWCEEDELKVVLEKMYFNEVKGNFKLYPTEIW